MAIVDVKLPTKREQWGAAHERAADSLRKEYGPDCHVETGWTRQPGSDERFPTRPVCTVWRGMDYLLHHYGHFSCAEREGGKLARILHIDKQTLASA